MNRLHKIFVFIFIMIVCLVSLKLYQQATFAGEKLHVVFCNVGQGDAIFVTTPKGNHILLDGGPDASVLTCLSKHMSLFDRNLIAIMLTHPHADHFIGLTAVLDRYIAKYFVAENLVNKTAGFQALMAIVDKHHIPIKYVHFPDGFSLDRVHVSFLGPTDAFLQSTSPNGTIGESKEFASLMTLITYGKCNLLLTGDSQAAELKEGLKRLGQLEQISVLQVPHHGSATGLSEEVLQDISPKLAIISVGAKNRYGHPAPAVLARLSDHQILVKRTDRDGDVEIVSDGGNCELKK